MVFWFLVAITALLLVLISMQISAFFSYWEMDIKTCLYQLTAGSETHYIEEIKNGPIKDYFTETSKKYGLPSGIKIYLLCGLAPVVISLKMEYVDDLSAFSVVMVTSKSKSHVFIPKQWITELTNEEMQCVICHEICHLLNAWKYRVVKALLLVHINPWKWAKNLYQKIKVAEEVEADAFAVAIVGKEVYSEFLKKLVYKYPATKTVVMEKRIAALTKV